jgi:hypothetical protein
MRFRLPRLSDVDRLFRRQRLERTLTRALPRLPESPIRVRVTGNPDRELVHRFRLRKDGHRILVEFDHRRILPDQQMFRVYRHRAGFVTDLFARTDPGVTEARAEISDGSASGDGWISFSSPHPGSILIPDCDFCDSLGYASMRRLALGPGPDWQDRVAGFCWRGSTTGLGLVSTDGMEPDDPSLIQRTRFCLKARKIPDADCKLSSVVQSRDSRDRDRLARAGILGEPIDPVTWRARKFAMDIDGNSNAWSNLFTRLLLGCCVIKVGSPRGFRQWYYDQLVPFETFVPVRADLSDLADRLEWCRTHDLECRAIAAAGQALALRLTQEGERDAAVERINRAFAHGAASSPSAA